MRRWPALVFIASLQSCTPAEYWEGARGGQAPQNLWDDGHSCDSSLDCAIVEDSSLDFRGHIPSQRSDLCHIASGLANGSLNVQTALRGLNLTFVHAKYDDAWPAFHKSLAEMLARVGHFHFTITEHPVSAFQPDLAWSEYLYKAIDAYDLSLDWWLATPDRLAAGATLPMTFLDLSIVSAKYYPIPPESSFSEMLIDVLNPFTWRLWITTAAIILVTALVYPWVDRSFDCPSEGCGSRVALSMTLSSSDGRASSMHQFCDSIYAASCQFTGAGGFAPQRPAGKLVLLSFSVVVLVVLADYSAMLAARLIAAAGSTGCDTIIECIVAGDVFCVEEGGAVHDWVLSRYPSLVDSFGRVPRLVPIRATRGRTAWPWASATTCSTPCNSTASPGRPVLQIRDAIWTAWAPRCFSTWEGAGRQRWTTQTSAPPS